jgi:hypothetical protein
MPKQPKPYLRTALEASEIQAAIKSISEKMTKSIMFGPPSTTTATHAFAGLRAVLEGDKWKFGTIHKSKFSDSYVMVVGYRKVIGLTYPGHDGDGPTDTVEDYFDYWEPVT